MERKANQGKVRRKGFPLSSPSPLFDDKVRLGLSAQCSFPLSLSPSPSLLVLLTAQNPFISWLWRQAGQQPNPLNPLMERDPCLLCSPDYEMSLNYRAKKEGRKEGKEEEGGLNFSCVTATTAK